MSEFLKYNDPLKVIWRKGDSTDPFPPLSDTQKIINNTVLLKEIPDEFNRVIINGYSEITNGEPTSTQFKVDYRTGIIFFNSSEEGKTVTANFFGRGQILHPASRVYVHNENPNVVETLQDLVDDGKHAIDAIGNLQPKIDEAYALKESLEEDINTGNTLHSNLQSDISTGNNLKTELETNIIPNSQTAKANLEATISTANTTDEILNTTVANANTTKDSLDDSITLGETTKTDLDTVVDNANIINDKLSNPVDGTIKLADDKNNILNTTISNANIADNDLKDTISTADLKNTTLNNTISNAESIQYVLDEKVEDIEFHNPFVEKFIATENQQQFILTKGQYKDIPMTQVYIQGVYINPIEDFVLVDDEERNKIYINEPLPLGTEVRVHVLQTLPIESGGNIIP